MGLDEIPIEIWKYLDDVGIALLLKPKTTISKNQFGFMPSDLP